MIIINVKEVQITPEMKAEIEAELDAVRKLPRDTKFYDAYNEDFQAFVDIHTKVFSKKVL